MLQAIKSKDAEVRFYAAEALAYLDRREAAEPLGQIARDQPAFRVFALTALERHAGVRRGRPTPQVAVAAQRRNALRGIPLAVDHEHKDPLVKGELLGDDFQYHVLDVAGPPMIHVTHNRLSEIVLFGPEQRLLTPLAINAGNDIMITSFGGDQIAVSKYPSPTATRSASSRPKWTT